MSGIQFFSLCACILTGILCFEQDNLYSRTMSSSSTNELYENTLFASHLAFPHTYFQLHST